MLIIWWMLHLTVLNGLWDWSFPIGNLMMLSVPAESTFVSPTLSALCLSIGQGILTAEWDSWVANGQVSWPAGVGTDDNLAHWPKRFPALYWVTPLIHLPQYCLQWLVALQDFRQGFLLSPARGWTRAPSICKADILPLSLQISLDFRYASLSICHHNEMFNIHNFEGLFTSVFTDLLAEVTLQNYNYFINAHVKKYSGSYVTIIIDNNIYSLFSVPLLFLNLIVQYNKIDVTITSSSHHVICVRV